MENEKRALLFYGSIVLTVVALSFCVYHAIPGIYHVPVPDYAEPTKVHEKYIALFGGLAVLGIIGAVIARFTSSVK